MDDFARALDDVDFIRDDLRRAVPRKIKFQDVNLLGDELSPDLVRQQIEILADKKGKLGHLDAPYAFKWRGKTWLSPKYYPSNEQAIAQKLWGKKRLEARVLDLDEMIAAKPGKIPPATRQLARDLSDDMEVVTAKTHDTLAAALTDRATWPEQKRIREKTRSLLDKQGFMSRDVSRRNPFRDIWISQRTPHGAAYHGWDGEIVFSPLHGEQVKEVTGEIAKHATNLPRPEEATRKWMPYGSLFHEELHGHSPLKSSAYRGRGIGLEEAGTEILARKMSRESLGYAHPSHKRRAFPLPTKQPVVPGSSQLVYKTDWPQAYDDYVNEIFTAVDEIVGPRNIHAKIEKAFELTRGLDAAWEYETAADAINDFVKGMRLKPDKAKQLRERLMTSEKLKKATSLGDLERGNVDQALGFYRRAVRDKAANSDLVHSLIMLQDTREQQQQLIDEMNKISG
jgi:hypothetical protein